jgi:hypothetical protein
MKSARLVALFLPLALPAFAAACLTPGNATLEVSPKAAIAGPRVLAVMGTHTEFVAELERELAARGFTFRPYRSDRITAPGGQVRVGENATDNTKYALEVLPDIFDRCVGGGFMLTGLRVSVIDRSSNELMLRSTAKGRTERCFPASGTVFHDIAKAIDAAWQK